MTNSPVISPATQGTVAILGRSPMGLALEALCSRQGFRSSVLEVPGDADPADLAAPALTDCDVLIDTMSEEDARGTRLLTAIEALLPQSALVLSLTRYRPLSPRAHALQRPGNFAGLVQPTDLDEPRILEIVRTASTSDETLGRLIEFMRRLGRTALVVSDSPGFFSPRVSTSFLNEGMALVGDGVPATTVERAALDAGMSCAPLAMLDRLSLKQSDELLHQELHDLEHAAPTIVGGETGEADETRRISSTKSVDHRHGHGQHEHDHRHHSPDQVNDHGAVHGHGHEHGHDHHDSHTHSHTHSHDHDRSDDHSHDHDHGHSEDHSHDHDHDHSRTHEHDHAHARSGDGNDPHQKHDQGPHDAHGVDDHQHGTHPTAQPATVTSGRAHKHSHKVKSKRMPEPAVYVMEKMAHGYRRMGREAGAGFYEYADDGSTTLWSGLKAFERRSVRIAEEDVRDRLLFIQALEAVRCLEEGVVGSAADVDIGSIGLCGFPAASGGVVQFINGLGMARFVERARELAARFGDRFLPTAHLVDLASRHEPLQDGPSQRATPPG